MHVLMIPAWFSHSPSGGEGVFVIEHARAAMTAGAKVGIIFTGRKGERGLKEWTDRGVAIMTQSAWHLPKVGILRRQWHVKYDRVFSTYFDKHGLPDVLHAHSYMAGEAARLLGTRYGIPYVLTEHATGIVSGVPFRQRQILRKAVFHASGVIAVSKFLKKGLAQYVDTGTVHVIPNPVDTSLFAMADHRRSAKTLRLISAGSLEYRKGFDILIDALAGLVGSGVDAALEIIGNGPDMDKLKQRAAKLGVGERIEFSGHLSLPEIARRLTAAEAYVSCSRLETFGVAAIEAMSCGLPVITTPNGGIPELIHDGNGLVCRDLNAKSMTKTLIEYCKMRNSFDPVKIRREVQIKYDLPVVGRKLCTVYEQVVGTVKSQ